MTTMPDWFSDFLAERDRERHEEADRQLATFTPREQRLIREASVCGFVQGVMHAGGLMRVEIPKDSETVFLAINTAQMHPDLYPLLGGGQ